MTTDDRDGRRPPRRFSDADGSAYWTAERLSTTALPDESGGVVGSYVRFFPEIGGGLPLWDANGLLDDDPDWLMTHLGLDAELVADLIAWGNAGDDPRVHGAAREQWRRDGQRLVDAVAALLPPHLKLSDQRDAADR